MNEPSTATSSRDRRPRVGEFRRATLAPPPQLRATRCPARPLVNRALGYGRAARAISGDREEYRVRSHAEHTHAWTRVLPSDIVDGENAVAQRPSTLNNQPSTAA